MMKHFVGIDHGTTFSAVAAIAPGSNVTRIIELGQSQQQIPTVVCVDDRKTVTSVGTNADHETAVRPGDVLKWYKPRMENEPDYTFKGIGLLEIATAVLQSIKTDVEAKINEPLERALLTVPAWFHDRARKMTIEAAQRAGIQDVELENEPTAAAFALHKQQPLKPDEVVLVYDLGGGTFDVSVVRYDGGTKRLEVLASRGDMDLGGHLWTIKLVEAVVGRYAQNHGVDLKADPATFYELYRSCELAKQQLTKLPKADVRLTPPGSPPEKYTFTRDEFEALTSDLLTRTGTVMEEALRAAKLSWGQIGRVLLVGGATRMKQVERFVEQTAGRKPELPGNRDQIVAEGAALLLQHLRRQKDRYGGVGTIDAITKKVPHPLSTWVVKSRQLACSVLVAQDSVVPARGRRRFKRQHDHATEIDIPVFQSGIDGAIIDPRQSGQGGAGFLRKYHFTGVPKGKPAAADEIEVTFSYTREETIEVTAVYQPGTPDEVKLSGVETDWVIDENFKPAEAIPIVALVDCSSSMQGQKIEDVRTELAKLADEYANPAFSFSVVAFPYRLFDKAGVVVRGATAPNQVKGHLGDLIASGSTPMAEGLREAGQVIQSSGITNNDRYVILITDGEADDAVAAVAAGNELKQAGITLYAIPVGTTPALEQWLNSFCQGVQRVANAGGVSAAFQQLLSS